VKSPVQYGSEVYAFASYLNNYQLLPYERICDLFDDMLGIRPSEATLINANTSIYNNLEATEDRIKELIADSPVVNYDETGVSVNGKNNWIHSASTDNLNYYVFHKKRGQKVKYS
jgi:transposase